MPMPNVGNTPDFDGYRGKLQPVGCQFYLISKKYVCRFVFFNKINFQVFIRILVYIFLLHQSIIPFGVGWLSSLHLLKLDHNTDNLIRRNILQSVLSTNQDHFLCLLKTVTNPKFIEINTTGKALGIKNNRVFSSGMKFIN